MIVWDICSQVACQWPVLQVCALKDKLAEMEVSLDLKEQVCSLLLLLVVAHGCIFVRCSSFPSTSAPAGSMWTTDDWSNILHDRLPVQYADVVLCPDR